MPLSPRVDPRGPLDAAARRLLARVDLDPYSPTRGCFDRRYWGWKLVDFPEATYQRAVSPLGMLYADPESALQGDERVREAVLAGIGFGARIQHRNGSFDQAFPNEQSFGATAFLLHSFASAITVLREADAWPETLDAVAADCLRSASRFLCRAGEHHGRITNHIAGAAAGLLAAAASLDEPSFRERARELIAGILASQSEEGWYPEYEGADPGYQTLCIHYLADAHRLDPDPVLADALGRAVGFIAHFVHPDGSFAGEYGSRRTGLFHPGGVARLSSSDAVAAAVLAAVQDGLANGRTPGPDDIDTGNLAPLLAGHVVAARVGRPDGAAAELPCGRPGYRRDFPAAGLYVRGGEEYYAVLGVLTGGVLKVFDRESGACLLDDGGYAASIGGRTFSTQITGAAAVLQRADDRITIEAPFHLVRHALPGPGRFILLRLLNLTVMRSITVGNAIKRLLVRLLITGRRPAPLVLRRTVRFRQHVVEVEDRVRAHRGTQVEWLRFGAPFRGIHMASAGYSPAGASAVRVREVDAASLRSTGEVRVMTIVGEQARA
ncbi:MAG TPA: hypothetical protein VMN39_11480 [Longimicrobiaceae bacterium]|nr:hypothetical protein [Longimicrobiaceae bacterium]